MPLDRPELLFASERERTREIWKRLRQRWHPDRSRGSESSLVFAHVQSLYQSAIERIEAGLWDDGETLELRDAAGKRFRLRYLHSGAHELGRWLVGRGIVAHLFEGEAADWAQAGWAAMEAMPFADEAMRESLGLQLPEPARLVAGVRYALLLQRKPADFVPLVLLHQALGGAVPARHLAWIISGLLNLACYLEWSQRCHLGIAAEHCLVSPSGHGVKLVGGWWFSRPNGQRFDALPVRSARLAPPDVLARREADSRIDTLSIRQLGLELLGAHLDETPAPMLDFLSLPGSGSAAQDYADWQRALWASFGERRFSELALSADDIYAMTSASFDERRV